MGFLYALHFPPAYWHWEWCVEVRMIPVKIEMFVHVIEMSFEVSMLDEWLREWKCSLVTNRCESDKMDESLINLWVNVEDKEWTFTQWTLKMFISGEGHMFVIIINDPHVYDWLAPYIWKLPIQNHWWVLLVEWLLLNNISLSYRNMILCESYISYTIICKPLCD